MYHMYLVHTYNIVLYIHTISTIQSIDIYREDPYRVAVGDVNYALGIVLVKENVR